MTATIDHQRPVARHMVHRTSTAEVFVGDISLKGSEAFSTTAQLPRTHCYYNDRAGAAGAFDPLAALEAMRQATILFAHTGSDVPLDSAFLFTTARFEVTDHGPREHASFVEAEISGRVLDWKVRDGARTGYTLELEFVGALGHRIRMEIGAQWMPRSAWEKLRLRQRAALDLNESAVVSPKGRHLLGENVSYRTSETGSDVRRRWLDPNNFTLMIRERQIETICQSVDKRYPVEVKLVPDAQWSEVAGRDRKSRGANALLVAPDGYVWSCGALLSVLGDMQNVCNRSRLRETDPV